MNVEIHGEVRAFPPHRAPREAVANREARVVEYVRQPAPSLPVPATDTSWRASTGAAVRAVLPWWVVRLLAAWGLITLASLVGPCNPPAPSPAWASPEIAP